MNLKRISHNNYLGKAFEDSEFYKIFVTMSLVLHNPGAETIKVVQNFNIFPALDIHLSYNTKVRSVIFYQFIKNLYISNVFSKEIKFSKTNVYSPSTFSVEYDLNEHVYKNSFIRDFEKYSSIVDKKEWEIRIAKELVIPEDQVGKCISCLYYNKSKKCPNKMIMSVGKSRRCEDYDQR